MAKKKQKENIIDDSQMVLITYKELKEWQAQTQNAIEDFRKGAVSSITLAESSNQSIDEINKLAEVISNKYTLSVKE